MNDIALTSTYRVQFHRGFRFVDAADLTDYFNALGISHVYASPYLRAAAGSTHGYDVVDHGAVNPEVGTDADRQRWVEQLADAGMAHILDIVPNHMGVATNDNAWWNDVLEYGRGSAYASHFDIAWEGTANSSVRDKLVLPVLADSYASSLEQGVFRIGFDATAGRFYLELYGERRFPLSPASYAQILKGSRFADRVADAGPDASPREQGERVKRVLKADESSHGELAALAGKLSAPAASHEAMHRLLEAQCYRLSHWRSSNGTINYRRFFDVSELAALAMERQEVFDAAHRLVMEWVRDGSVTGLRVDHPDGLSDPKAYFDRLQQSAGRPVYVVAEKILGDHEALSQDWNVAGTTGYDFLTRVNGLFVDCTNGSRMQEIYECFVGQRMDYASLVTQNKRRICDESMSSELTLLAERLHRIAQGHLATRDIGFIQLRAALREMTAAFPVYRTYITADGFTGDDERAIDACLRAVRNERPRPDDMTLAFIRDTLLSRDPAAVEFALRFQQFTSPVMAKGVEDTTFYQYKRLVSLNEVGGEPSRFGIEPDALHAFFAERQKSWPLAMSTLSTHDTKRSEDVRARINVLSEIPDQWEERVSRWKSLNEQHRTKAGPDRNTEYALYQNLIGAYPPTDDDPAREAFTERIIAVTLKSIREAKLRTSWNDVDEAYESAVERFVRAILNREQSSAFLDDFVPFARSVARAGVMNSIAQTIIKLVAPGVPDTYQGTELFDFSLVDPDNRRPVDYVRRRLLLERVNSQNPIDPLVDSDAADSMKLRIHQALLRLRRRYPELLTVGSYRPVEASGPLARNVFAFERAHAGRRVLAAIPRLLSAAVMSRGAEWHRGPAGDETVLEGIPKGAIDLLTGQPIGEAGGRPIAISAVLRAGHGAVLYWDR